VFEDDGAPAAIVGVSSDISELDGSEDRFRASFDDSGDLLVVTDAEGKRHEAR
jgi:PAS domain-containing protein